MAHRLSADRAGVSTIEFALVAPVFLLLVVGMADLAHSAYASAVLKGAVQQAARASSLETADIAAADGTVRTIVGGLLPGMQLTSQRASYFDFADVGRAERWNDANANGSCDNGEAFTDENGDGRWNADIGQSGNGGAGDVVLYTVTATYTSPFAVPLVPSSMNRRALTAVAVRKNQPFAAQKAYGSSAGSCP